MRRVTTYFRVWTEMRLLALTPDQAASPMAARPYDLRHAALSTWLNSGVDPTEVAERAGNSVEVMLSRYAKCVDGRAAAVNQRIGDMLGDDPTKSTKSSKRSSRAASGSFGTDASGGLAPSPHAAPRIPVNLRHPLDVRRPVRARHDRLDRGRTPRAPLRVGERPELARPVVADGVHADHLAVLGRLHRAGDDRHVDRLASRPTAAPGYEHRGGDENRRGD
jgi:hypothetical protein